MRLTGASNATAIARAFGLKGVFIALNFALITLAARAFDAGTFGTYSMLFSAAGLFGIAATFGQQVLVMRFWSEYRAAERFDLLKGGLIFSVAACLLGCVLFGVPFYLWCAASYDDGVEIAITVYLVMFSLVMTTAHLVRSAVGVGIGDGAANILLALSGALYLAICMVTGVPADLAVVFGAMAAGATLAIIIHVAAVSRSLAACPVFFRSRPSFQVSQWVGRSARLWLSHTLEAANQYLDVLVIGFLMDPVTAGAWFVLTRVANIISVASDAIHMFATRHIPELYFRGDTARLSDILDAVAWVVLMVVVSSIVGIVIAGGLVLAIFNNSYVAYHGVLIVLTIGAAGGAAAGASPSLLMLTGHEGRYLALIAGAVLLRVCAFAVLIPIFDLAGAAIAITLSQLSLTLLLRRSVRNCTGIDGSVLRIIPKIAPGLLSARQG